MPIARKGWREDVIYVCISLVIFLGEPALAASGGAEYSPANFTTPLKVSRGKVAPPNRRATYLSHDETCRFLEREQGWSTSDCPLVEYLVIGNVGDIDSMIIQKPVDEGYVKFDDWTESKDAINELWASFVSATAEQSKKLNKKIQPISWYVYPTLRKDQAYLYYAILLNWDGEKTINIKASKFDRYGYVPYLIVPANPNLTAAQVETLVQQTLGGYSSDPEKSYFEFRDGDKVAAVGAVGVLAALLGVKYGKAAAVGLLALLIAVGKKLAFVLLVIPYLAFKRLFGRKAPPQV